MSSYYIPHSENLVHLRVRTINESFSNNFNQSANWIILQPPCFLSKHYVWCVKRTTWIRKNPNWNNFIGNWRKNNRLIQNQRAQFSSSSTLWIKYYQGYNRSRIDFPMKPWFLSFLFLSILLLFNKLISLLIRKFPNVLFISKKLCRRCVFAFSLK